LARISSLEEQERYVLGGYRGDHMRFCTSASGGEVPQRITAAQDDQMFRTQL